MVLVDGDGLVVVVVVVRCVRAKRVGGSREASKAQAQALPTTARKPQSLTGWARHREMQAPWFLTLSEVSED